MDFDNILTENCNMSGIYDENLPNIDFNETSWNCVTSTSFLECYLKNFTDEEEKKVGAIHSKPGTNKELNCSPAEYQQSITILRKNNWFEQLCKCSNCLIFYQKHNADFLFDIKNIECLPTKILLVIFKKLPPSDRRVASECCKRFLEVWLCDDFIDDRRLVLNKFELDPEILSTFSKSQRIYRHLVCDIEMDASNFGTIFGENVTTLELTCPLFFEDDIINLSILSEFPNLKTLEVYDIFLLGDFSNVPTTLELLVIYEHFDDYDDFHLLNYLEKTSDSFRVELSLTISTEHILNFTESQRKKIQRVFLILQEYDESFKIPHFENLKYLELSFFGEFGTEEILDNLEEQLPALVDLSISINNQLPHKNWTCLKILDASEIPKEEISRLNIFENLNELTLGESADDDRCFFTHEAFLNKNLKKLDIPFRMSPCRTCFQKMTQSFPNLENFTCNFNVMNDHLRNLTTNMPKLKYLELDLVDQSVSFEHLPNNLCKLNIKHEIIVNAKMIEKWPLMSSLREFEIMLTCVDFETVEIFKKMPALEDLDLFCDRTANDCASLFKTMSKYLKRLKRLKFDCIEMLVQDRLKLVDEMATNCIYLQSIMVHGIYEEDEAIEQLLQKHPSLRSIN